jgi:hypothetical protein
VGDSRAFGGVSFLCAQNTWILSIIVVSVWCVSVVYYWLFGCLVEIKKGYSGIVFLVI